MKTLNFNSLNISSFSHSVKNQSLSSVNNYCWCWIVEVLPAFLNFYILTLWSVVFFLFLSGTNHSSRSESGVPSRTRSSAVALLKPRLRRQMLNTSNPIFSSTRSKRIRNPSPCRPAPWKWRVNAAARRLNVSEVIRRNAGRGDAAADGASHLCFKRAFCRKMNVINRKAR